MSVRKSERLMNLLIMLLVARRHVPKDEIQAQLYADSSDDAFERMFERDKDELRSLGVPIESGNSDPLFEDMSGYRIPRDEFELPQIELAPDEGAVLGLAARVWQHAGLAGAASGAIRKLKAAGIEVDQAALELVETELRGDEPAFPALWSATQERRRVSFDYRSGGSSETTRRTLEPWRVAWSSSRWYVLGRDVDKDEARLFRLSRIVGEVTPGPTGAGFEVPDELELAELTHRLAPPEPADEAIAQVLVRSERARGLRRLASSTEFAVAGPDGTKGWDRLHITLHGEGLADLVLSFGADAYVEEPAELRTEVIGRFRALSQPQPDVRRTAGSVGR